MDYQGDNLRDFLQTNGRQVLQRVENNYSLKYFTENEIRNITDGYKSILGRGAFGEVYKGTLEDQTSVAVKRYIRGTQKEVFAKEVIVHSQINHKNVVRLLGCCTEENALMIVMEFISNGNLDSILHGNSTNGRVPFPLDKRIEIAIEVAEVLWCMHSMYSPVLHGDIKPANILLDKNLTPKISDFGIARLLCANGPQQTSYVIGSIGYLDPAYCESGILTPKSDVYSFGVVLLEVITRKKAVDGTITLAQSFNEALTKGEDVHVMFDEEISAAENIKFLGDIGQLAAKCLRRDIKTRPEMAEVAFSLWMIRKAMHIDQENLSQQHASVPNNSVPSNNVWTAGYQFGNLKIFNETEMKKLTKNYRMTFRKESCKCLYNGVLDKDRPVIVRQLKICSDTDRAMFLNTMSILSQKNHKNIANVVGFHIGKSISDCVYESFCDLSKSKFGSLSLSNRNLHDTICSIEKIPLHQRLSIAVQCAEGLVHIHSLVAESPDLCGSSLLGNFRSVNIFLDNNFVPKIFNWNLSTFLGLSTVQNTIHDNGQEYYSDPRDVSSQLFNLKSDVYSFGVVLLELITWKTVRYMYDGRVHVLTTDFLHSYRTDHGAIEFFGKVYDEQGKPFIHEAIAIAVDCLQPHIEKRPEMNVVLSRLRIIASAQSIRSKLTGTRNEISSLLGTTSKFASRNGAAGLSGCSSHTSSASMLPTPRSEDEILESANIKAFTFNELRTATRNFRPDNVLSEGRFGRVFKGWIDEKTLAPTRPGTGMVIAIKKLNQEGFQGHKEWLIEVNYLGTLSHPYLVKLIGYCLEDKQRLLVYEFMARGSLENHLFRRSSSIQPLPWSLQMKIALGAAKGLAYLHSDEAKVIYRDFQTSNVLLDANFNAKLSDFGLAKDEESEDDELWLVRRTPGYADPEYLATGHLTTKSDVYSFGVVLLEMLSGRRALDKNRQNEEHNGYQNLVEWARPYLRSKRRIVCILDPRLGGQYSLAGAQKAAALALQCLSVEPRHRPSMEEVVTALEQLQDTKEGGNHHQQKRPSSQNKDKNGVKSAMKGKPAPENEFE